MDSFSFLGNSEIDSVDQLYSEYKKDKNSVDVTWQRFFEGFDFALKHYGETTPANNSGIQKEFKVINLIDAYRKRGHLFTKTNPVRQRRQYEPTLDIANYGLTDADLDTEFHAGSEIGIGTTTLRNIVAYLKETYCKSIGSEYMFIRKPDRIAWLQNAIEPNKNQSDLSVEVKKQIFHYLIQAVGFENFIHRRFTGQKRFSLEGTESLIPALHYIMDQGAELGIEDFVIGMAHRGRLNVLANVLRKPYENIFNEFVADEYEDCIALGDVKYH